MRLIGICTRRGPRGHRRGRIGDGGGGKLKADLTEALNAHLAPMRERRARYAQDPAYVKDVLRRGIARAREEGIATLKEVRKGDEHGPRPGLGFGRVCGLQFSLDPRGGEGRLNTSESVP